MASYSDDLTRPARVFGWCKTPGHPSTDHARTDGCLQFVSDAEHTARMLAEADEHDRHADGGVEARYVEQHRPY